MKFRIWRGDIDGQNGRYETFEVDVQPGMSVLDALFDIRDKQDDSLAFRFSCRGAVCGSCAMMINREPRLACRTQLSTIGKSKGHGLRPFTPLEKHVEWDRGTEVLIEPLPNLPVLKDLVVDMSRFFEAYRKIKPWIDARVEQKAFSKIMQDEAQRIEQYTNCILCAACFGACPVCDSNPEYLGPAALSWELRFMDDVRSKDREERMKTASLAEAVPGCQFVYNCVKVCPKQVAPAKAIGKLKSYIS
jgi:succinate dehydrogenase / fumarate reductase iron-sulfur subunit